MRLSLQKQIGIYTAERSYFITLWRCMNETTGLSFQYPNNTFSIVRVHSRYITFGCFDCLCTVLPRPVLTSRSLNVSHCQVITRHIVLFIIFSFEPQVKFEIFRLPGLWHTTVICPLKSPPLFISICFPIILYLRSYFPTTTTMSNYSNIFDVCSQICYFPQILCVLNFV